MRTKEKVYNAQNQFELLKIALKENNTLSD